MEKKRIQKLISEMGIASRREAERWINEGRFSVDGKIVKDLGLKVDPAENIITLDGKPLPKTKPPKVYWILHKPDKTLTSRRGEAGKKTIFDLPKLNKIRFLVFPVGRLDYRSEGLLLLSNDGEFVHRLSHPRHKVPKHYCALISGKLEKADLEKIKQGIVLEDGPVNDVEIKHAHGLNLGKSSGNWYFITVQEGRNRLVRRIFEKFGFKVVRLVRHGFGDLRLPDDLPPGHYRQVNARDVEKLKKLVGLT